MSNATPEMTVERVDRAFNPDMRNFILRNTQTLNCSSVYANAITGRVKRINWTDEPDGLTFATAGAAIANHLSQAAK